MTRLVVVFALMLSACSSAIVAPTVTPATVALDGQVKILNPQADTSIYDELLTVSGTADVPSFILKLMDSADQSLAQVTVQTNAGAWCVELPHSYNGEAIPVHLVAAPLTAGGEYDSVSVSLAGFRPSDEPFIRHQPCSN